MNKTFFMALMLASGMALAQSSGSSPGSMDQSQPSSQQSQPSTQQSQPSTQQNQPTTSQNPSSSGQSSMTGCLKGSDGAWVIVAQGQSTPVKGDSSTLSPHNGHQVQLKGTQASDGSFQVTDVVMIAESCPTQQSDASSGAGAAAGAVSGAVGATAATAQQAGDTAADTSGTVQRSASYQSAAGNPQSSTSSDQSANPSSGQTSGQTSNPSSGQTTNPSGGQGTTQSTNPSGQSTAPSSSMGDQTTPGQGKKLPQTASPLPLLGFLGLGSLVTGLIARRRK
jgi:hypothetical protein